MREVFDGVELIDGVATAGVLLLLLLLLLVLPIVTDSVAEQTTGSDCSSTGVGLPLLQHNLPFAAAPAGTDEDTVVLTVALYSQWSFSDSSR